MDVGNEEENDSVSRGRRVQGAALYFWEEHLVRSQNKRDQRTANFFRQRLHWPTHRAQLSSSEFQRYYRLDKETFDVLLERLRPLLAVDEAMAMRGSSGPVSPELQLSMTLRFLAGGSYLDLILLHGVHRSTFFKAVWRVIDAINDTHNLLFPLSDSEQLVDIADAFQTNRGSPQAMWGCVGAVDGLCIEILRPIGVENSRSFFNRKGFFAIPLQALVDSDYRFRYGAMTVTGSTHDSTAFSACSLGHAIAEGRLCPPFWIAADAAYAASDCVLTPWSGKQLPKDKDSFNYWLSKNRVVVEQAFGMLVARWGILWRPLEVACSDVPKLVMALLKLHNLCVERRVQLLARHPEDVRDGDRLLLVFQDEAHEVGEARRRRRDLERSSVREQLTNALLHQGQYRPVRQRYELFCSLLKHECDLFAIFIYLFILCSAIQSRQRHSRTSGRRLLTGQQKQ